MAVAALAQPPGHIETLAPASVYCGQTFDVVIRYVPHAPALIGQEHNYDFGNCGDADAWHFYHWTWRLPLRWRQLSSPPGQPPFYPIYATPTSVTLGPELASIAYLSTVRFDGAENLNPDWSDGNGCIFAMEPCPNACLYLPITEAIELCRITFRAGDLPGVMPLRYLAGTDVRLRESDLVCETYAGVWGIPPGVDVNVIAVRALR
jgi:hypothetical protein